MKRKSKMVTYAMTGALSLGIIGGTIIPTYAATVQKETVNVEEYKKLDAETQQKVDEILNNLRKELAELGISFPTGKGDKFANLDDETKTKVQEITKQVEDGSLTQEEADAQLKELGVSLLDHNFKGKGDKFSNLDDETRTKVQAIMKKVQEGSLTQKEADTQLKELGVSLPDHNFMGKGDKFSNLDDETRTKVQAIMKKVQDGSLTQEEADTQLKELGVSLPDHNFMGKGNKFSNLDDETRMKVQAIMKQVEDGSLTQEEADGQLKDLRVSLPDHNFKGKGDKFENLDDETKKEVTKLIEKAKAQMEELGVDLPTKFNQLID
ncbi:hypothetical protein [Lysinibacillus sp. NPDC047702]|uniref:hypothetical protein n=1 Tax=unclassified Lysinibacillus TaxID=2636778 RepID=UPI003CFE10A6